VYAGIEEGLNRQYTGQHNKGIKGMKRPRSRVAIISVLLLSILIFGGVFYGWTLVTDILLQPANKADNKEVSITVPKNATTADIADELQSKGLIRNTTAFRIWARIKGLDTKLQAGVYKGLKASMTTSEIIDILLNGQPDEVLVTIVEGSRLEQIAAALEEHKIKYPQFDKAKFLDYTKNIDKFPDKSKYPLLQQVPANYHTMEGLLFPDTYSIAGDATTVQIIDMMLNEMVNNIAQNNLEKLAKEHQYTSTYQMLVMASIVERETGNKNFRPGIASVYWNRIFKQNDETVGLLNADPTVQYARDSANPPTKYWASLQDTPKDIEPNSPWNTYNQQGLTPTPICSPGLESLKDAASPPASDNYYFFASNDGNTYFAKTLAEMNQLIAEHPINN
jgi:UPF0755 protein